MSKRIVVDPITRIEGHLRIEVVVDDNNVIQEAYSTSTLWRGLEQIVKGRDPRDVGFMVQRICGVCTYSHYKAGIVAVENALNIEPPYNAKMVRSLMNQALFLHDHPVHFYHLHGLDWCDITKALEADPAKAAKLAFKYSDDPVACGENDLIRVQKRLKDFVSKGSLGPFANAYWGHETYHFTPEQNLIVAAHYLEGLRIQRTAAQMMAMFGSKQPHPQTLTVGGVTCVMDMLNPARLGEWLTKFQEVAHFVNNAYYADIVMAAEMFAKEPSVNQNLGVKNFLSYKEIQVNRTEYLLASGVVMNNDLSTVYEVNEDLITEEATRSWYKNDAALHPYNGETEPNYTGFIDGKNIHVGHDANGKPIAKEAVSPVINKDGKYSWIKSPRYDGKPMEVGPLANIVVGYAKGDKRTVKVVNDFLKKTGLPAAAIFTTLGRTAARMLEAKLVCDYGMIAFNELVNNIKAGDTETVALYDIDKTKEYKGRYIGNVPRGMLSHWIRIKNGVVENYQCVVPSTWNAGAKDAKGQMGPYEESLVGTPIKDVTQPLEIVRVIHSFDPCIACAVHVMDTKGKKLGEYKVDPNYGTC